MKAKDTKSGGDGYWFTRDSRTQSLPVSKGQKPATVGAPGSRPRRDARRLYAEQLKAKVTRAASFKGWLREQA